MLVHVDTESWQSEINLITLLSETENNLQETEKLSIPVGGINLVHT